MLNFSFGIFVQNKMIKKIKSIKSRIRHELGTIGHQIFSN
jgi:hypothetical protein